MRPNQCANSQAPPPTPQPPKLLDRLRAAARNRGDSAETADILVTWVKDFILFHNKRHPADLGLVEATHFLEHVVKTAADALPALAQARAAIALLYGGVLGKDLGELPQPRPPRLLDQLRLVMRVRHYSRSTEECYVHWARRFILFHRKRHPRTMAAAEVEQFLTHLAVEGRVSASSQNQALNALLCAHRAIAVGARKPGDDDDLHARGAQRRDRCDEPAGPAGWSAALRLRPVGVRGTAVGGVVGGSTGFRAALGGTTATLGGD